MIIILVGLLLPLATQAAAYSTGWLQNPDHPPIQLRYMLTGQHDTKTKTVEALLEVKLEGDWKTYWRSPGEGGVAPSINWDLSTNLNHADWFWPMPERHHFLGVETLGYKHRIIFPMTLHIDDMAKPVFLSGKLTMSSCTNICVLTHYDISLGFQPSQLTLDESAMHRYNQGMGQVPKAQPSVNVEALSWDANAQELTIVANNQLGWHAPDLFVDANDKEMGSVSFQTPSITVDGQQLLATMKASSWFGIPDLLGKSLNITFSDNGFSAEETAVANDLPVTQEHSSTLAETIALALLGGLILNIMPCVLPVLGMKLSSVIAVQGLAKRQIRLQFIASAAGILFSFWLLAAFLALLKISGQALGWGIQFQSPYFIGAMVMVTAVFAANMLGLFEISLPSRSTTWLASKGDNSYLGHFIQGMFATLLATPCSAPFLGTAVAAALGGNILTLFAIFTALAIGMASPWLIIALFPSLAKQLPKPGKWMDYVKTLFGLMMLASSVWLLSLLGNFIGTSSVVLLSITLATTLLWQLGRKRGRQSAVLALSGLILVSGSGLIASSLITDQWAKPLPQDHAWQPLDIDSIHQAVNAGKTVFVDVTADWCITCKVNKVSVLLQDPVFSALADDNIIRMRGDWTKPSPYVTQYLRANGRYGVPFNIVYGPSAPQGIALPELLTKESVTDALKQAQGKQ